MAQFDSINNQFAELFKKIDQNKLAQSVILTPNKRLSRFIRDQYNHYQSNQGTANAWYALPCFSYQGWLQQLWGDLQVVKDHVSSGCMPLSQAQELLLWQQVIQEHPATPPLLSTSATAKLAMQAWRLVNEWHLDLTSYTDQNTQIFQHWCLRFSEVCAERGLVSGVLQPAIISEAVREHRIMAPKQIILYGFDDQTPQQKELFDAFKECQTQFDQFEFTKQAYQPVRHEFSSEQREIEASAIWAKQILQNQPNARIAIVAPQLAQQRERIERIFHRVFEPQSILPQQPQHAPGFNISAGQPLDQVPVIATALAVLGCNQQLIEIDLISQILRSPFIGIESELPYRALLDTTIREGDLQISLQQVKTAAGKANEVSDLYDRLGVFIGLSKQAKDAMYPSQWVELFSDQLLALGWPGSRPLDTLEYQQLQSWKEALLEYAALDHVVGQVNQSEAIHYLQTLLKQVSFQAQTKTSPIQILGVLEAAGLPFDYIWVMSMDDETMPPIPNPNPLIPIALQVTKQLPQSSAERELLYAKRLVHRLAISANTVVFSHATIKDDKQLLPSPLTANATLMAFELEAEESATEVLFNTRDIEASQDSCGPKVTRPEEIRGGSQLLKDQAACPFRAFARHRLHTSEIPIPVLGLDARERGTLLHEVLEIIWRRLRNQAKLLKLDESELDTLIYQAIDDALLSIKAKRFVGDRFVSIEKERLANQVRQWLTLEKQRTPFSVIFNEGKKTIKLGKLSLNIRYDRVDRLEDGRLFVLDYKTGKQQLGSWAGERPDEPQVPLYCVANSKKVAGAAFGQITAEEVAFKGIADEEIAPNINLPEELPKLDLPQNWQEILAHWQSVLDRLAQEFMAGAAEVDPKKPSVTCRFCELQSLCRIKEQVNQELTHDE